MPPQPTLNTPRLLLRPFSIDDATDVHRLAGDQRIADTTLNVPHPYHHDDAAKWIATHRPKFDAGQEATFAITLAHSSQLVGAIGLILDLTHHRAELGYWVGVDHWNRGYCTEAGHAIVDFAFNTLRQHKLTVHCLLRNSASARVIEKLGFQREGLRLQHVCKNGCYEDIVVFGLLRSHWLTSRH